MSRLLHATAAFFGVTAAYLTYAATVVPLVEPRRMSGNSPAAIDEDLLDPESKYAELFADIFPPNHWTRTSPPKTFEYGQAMFVLKDYQTPGQGAEGDHANRILAKPCAVIYFPTPWSRGKGPPPTDCIILEAPQGGTLEFDGPIQFLQREMPKLENAWLTGPVLIKSDMDEPGPGDDLEIVTQDVAVNERRIWTRAAVALRLGPHSGSGRDLEIRFLNDASGNRPDEFRVDGIQWIQLRQDVRLVIQHSEETSTTAFGFPHGPKEGGVDSASAAQIELACRGPLFVDVPKQIAEFERDVEVFFIHEQGPSDVLACENLQVAFADRRASTASPPAASGAVGEHAPSRRNALQGRTSFEPVRFVADGHPVTVTSQLRQFHARCRRLVYEVPDRRLTLEGLTENDAAWMGSSPMSTVSGNAAAWAESLCDVRLDDHRLAAPRIEYTWNREEPRRRLGTLRISGAGWLTGKNEAAESSQILSATWQEGLQIVRQGDQPVLSLFGRPELEGAGIGRLAAGEMHVWLREVDSASHAAGDPHSADNSGALMNVALDRMLATNGVDIDAPQLTARVGHLEAWMVATEGAAAKGSAHGERTARPSPRRRLLAASPKGESDRTQPYYVEAERLQVRALMPNREADKDLQQADITHLTLTGDVLLEERPGPEEQTPPLRIEADWLEAADVHTASMFFNAKGHPVVALADGKTLRGGAIHFDQGTNRFDVPTPGDLSLTVTQDLEGRPLARPLPLTVSWQGTLTFDGREAVLTNQVHASTPEQSLQTRKLVASLVSPVPIGMLEAGRQVDFAQLKCTGGVILDRRTFDGGGLAAQEHAEIPDLTIERSVNRVSANGPGWLNSVSLGRDDPLFAAAAGRPPAGNENPGLTYLRVDFQRGMRGQLDTRDVTFEGQVRCVRGPVASWADTLHVDGLAQLPQDTFVLNSATLRVGQRGTRAVQWHEIEAEGNVEIEGGLGEKGIFIGRGARLTYDQRKDLVVLDGGAGMAELIHEASIGGRKQSMTQKSVQFSPDPDHKYFHSSGFSQSSGGL